MRNILVVLVLLVISSAVFAQRGNRQSSNRHRKETCCEDKNKRGEKCDEDNRGGWFSRNRRECQHEKLDTASLHKDVNETEFGEFKPFNNSINDAEKTPGDSSNAKGADGGALNDPGNIDFGEFEDFSSTTNGTPAVVESRAQSNLPWTIAALAATILAGVLVRFSKTRKIRGLFLLLSVVLFGFYLGGCPCPISSMQNVMLAGMGVSKPWESMVWFLGLIPITFFFGKVWCGWVCHLGGLQEMIFKPGKLSILKTEKSAKILKGVRIFLLAVLVVQVVATRSNLFKEIDPFKTAFNLFSPNIISWILLGLLLLSSIFIYRPFCRTICPIGLVLGWVSRIPGASLLRTAGECSSCKLCYQSCDANAIQRGDYAVKIDNQDCMRCGQCLESCRKNKLKTGSFKQKQLQISEPAEAIEKKEKRIYNYPELADKI